MKHYIILAQAFKGPGGHYQDFVAPKILRGDRLYVYIRCVLMKFMAVVITTGITSFLCCVAVQPVSTRIDLSHR